MAEVLIPFINFLVVLDADGDRLLAKYYDRRSKTEQIKNEALLHKKTKTVVAKSDAEVLLLDSEIVVFKAGSECKFYISGPVEENELVLVGVLDVIYDTVSTLLRQQVDKRTMLDNLELILLTIDEAIDSGLIMELDSSAVVSRVLMKSGDAQASATPAQQPALGDLTISQALGMARDQLFKSLASRNDGF